MTTSYLSLSVTQFDFLDFCILNFLKFEEDERGADGVSQVISAADNNSRVHILDGRRSTVKTHHDER